MCVQVPCSVDFKLTHALHGVIDLQKCPFDYDLSAAADFSVTSCPTGESESSKSVGIVGELPTAS